jgi:ribonuclease HII
MLKSSYSDMYIEAGCDEAGRGCLAGPVFAAAVILPIDYFNPELNDSKKLSAGLREKLRISIEKEALSWAVAKIDNQEIDRINILNASILAMQMALDKLQINPQLILIDGNRFKKYKDIPYQTVIKGDSIFASIAAASVLAKTHRDEHMLKLHDEFPEYGWDRNRGYPTVEHRRAVLKTGFSIYHRRTFAVQLKVWE